MDSAENQKSTTDTLTTAAEQDTTSVASLTLATAAVSSQEQGSNESIKQSKKIEYPKDVWKNIAKQLGAPHFFMHRNARWVDDLGPLSAILKSDEEAYTLLKLEQPDKTDTIRHEMPAAFNKRELKAREDLYMQHAKGYPNFFLFVETSVGPDNTPVPPVASDTTPRAILKGHYLLCSEKEPQSGNHFRITLHNLQDNRSWVIPFLCNGMCLTDKLLVLTFSNKLRVIRLNDIKGKGHPLADVVTISGSASHFSANVVGHGNRFALLQDGAVMIFDPDTKQCKSFNIIKHGNTGMAMFADVSLWVFSDCGVDGLKVIELDWEGVEQGMEWNIADPMTSKNLREAYQKCPEIIATGYKNICRFAPNIVLDLRRKTIVYGKDNEDLTLWKDRAYSGHHIYMHDALRKLDPKVNTFATELGLHDITRYAHSYAGVAHQYAFSSKVHVNDTFYIVQAKQKFGGGPDPYTFYFIYTFDGLEMLDSVYQKTAGETIWADTMLELRYDDDESGEQLGTDQS